MSEAREPGAAPQDGPSRGNRLLGSMGAADFALLARISNPWR